MHLRRPLAPSLILALTSLAFVAWAPTSALADRAGGSVAEALDRGALIREGIALDFQGRHDEADAVWDRWIQIDPTDATPYLRKIDTSYWRHAYDELGDLGQTPISDYLQRAKELAGMRLEIEPDDLRARALLGSALMSEARYSGMTGHFVAAGRAGERGRDHLEQVIAQSPANETARFQLGLYNYYVSIAPRFVRYISWLWFIPKGDRDVGIEYLWSVANGDGVYRDDARMALAGIYTYHGPVDIDRAMVLAGDLRDRYPMNAIIQFEYLEILLKGQRYDELIANAQLLEARIDESPQIAGRALLARLWRARAELELGNPRAARKIVSSIDPGDPRLPTWGQPWMHVVRGQAYDLEGERERARAAYRSAIASSDDGLYDRPRVVAEAGLEAPYKRQSDRPVLVSVGAE